MNYTLPEVKKEFKAKGVNKVYVHLEEFGEGFDTHVSAYYLDRYNEKESLYFQMAEEEKFSKAEARAKRITESLKKAGYAVQYDGLANC